MKTIAILVVSACLFGFGNTKLNETSLELHCQSQPKDILSKEWVETDVPEGGWYFPLISKNVRKRISAGSELAHSDFYEKRQDRRPFCPRLKWVNGVGTLSYHEKKVVFNCINNSTISCSLWERNVEASTDKNSKPDRVKAFFTLTDNHSYILMFRCWEDGYKDWEVISSDKVLSKEVKEAILNEAESIGFDRESYYEIGYEKCLEV